jgi:hypothetical protein
VHNDQSSIASICLPQESTQKDLAPTHLTRFRTGAEQKGNGTRRCGSPTHVAIRKTESLLIRARSGSVSFGCALG